MFFLLYNVRIDQSKSISYAVEQYGEKTDQNVSMHVGCEPPAVMYS